MIQCPNCSYKLVLLSTRPKYKCSLCNKLYSQKQIDNKEFKEWNKIQRRLDIKNYEQEREKYLEDYQQEKRQELLKLKQLRSSIKLLFTSQKITKKCKIFKKYKKRYIKSKSNLKEWINQNTLSNEYKQKLKHRLNHYRQQQKRLTLLHLKNCNKEISTIKIFNPLHTFALSYLLTE